MIKTIQLLVFPFQTWQRIALSNSGAVAVLFVYFIPLLFLTLFLECLGLMRWGMAAGEFGRTTFLSSEMAQRYGVAQFLLSLAVLVVSAKLLQLVMHSFNLQNSFRHCFTVYAYGFSPILVMRMAHGLPMLNTWICWGIGAALSMGILYHGIGQVLRPDQTKGLGVFMMATMILLALSGLAQFISLGFLHGRF
jgi:hypothetical protein